MPSCAHDAFGRFVIVHERVTRALRNVKMEGLAFCFVNDSTQSAFDALVGRTRGTSCTRRNNCRQRYAQEAQSDLEPAIIVQTSFAGGQLSVLVVVAVPSPAITRVVA